MKLFFSLLTFLVLISSSPFLQAQPEGDMNAIMPGVERGVIRGQLYRLEGKKKIPVGNQVVAIMVFQGGQRILMLDKKSDAEGTFEFKNIFKDPSFSYSFGTIIDNQLYVLPEVQLLGEAKVKEVSFQVGEGSPYKVDVPHEMMTGNGEAAPAADAGAMAPVQNQPVSEAAKPLQYSYQKMTVALSALVLLLAFVFYRKKETS